MTNQEASGLLSADMQITTFAYVRLCKMIVSLLAAAVASREEVRQLILRYPSIFLILGILSSLALNSEFLSLTCRFRTAAAEMPIYR